MRKINSGMTDAVNCAQTLRSEGEISSDVCTYNEESFAGNLVDCYSEGELYKGLVCFLILGLKNCVPYMIKSSQETKINVNWFKEELIVCL